jgi:hypothetical protein
MRKPRPLSLRLYQEPHLTAIVRLLGYDGLPAPEAKERLKPLCEQFSQERMQAAVKELVEIDSSADPPVARLSATVRRLAWQLLGPPPEQAEQFRAPTAWPRLPSA